MRYLSPILLLFSSIVYAEQPQFSNEDLSFFEAKIRPLLSDKCYSCHSHKVESKKKLKANLFLDSRYDIIQGGNNGPAALPGKADESQIIKFITHPDTDERMPPKEKDWLSATEIQNLKTWISKGMAWPNEPRPTGAEDFRDLFDVEKRKRQHWAWNLLKKPELPKIDKYTHPVDKFISRKLQKNGLSLSPTADKETLIRRAYLDVSGQVPTADKVNEFLNDKSPQAFEKVIDQLLSSKSYGERWARHWLDLVRYAESHGHEFDYSIPHAYKYRDMVIRALNRDVPHDQWLKDHVAGDLLKHPRIDPETGLNESIIATGFWYFFEASHAPVDVKEDEVLRLNNQIDTFSKTFLALTVACARCHDHKFDAITAKDFYALSGYLQSSRRQEALLDPKGKINEAANKIENLKNQLKKLIPESKNQETEKYLLIASEIFSHTATNNTIGNSEIFTDFENGYEGWKTEGDAFGDKPLSDEYKTHHQVTGFSNKHYACSFHPHNLQGNNPDNRTGKLISPEFTISKKMISFLVAGGNHKNQTCVNLEIGGKTVLSQSGFNNRDLREIKWDVSQWQGKKARIVLLDTKQGGWGHISADRFILSDTTTIFTKEPIDTIVQKHSLNKAALIDWLLELQKAYSDPAHPFYILAQASHKSPEQINRELLEINKQASEFYSKTKLFEDFSSDNYNNLRLTGQAFPMLANPGAIDSGYFGPKFQGVVRTKDFIIESPQIFYKISGTKSKARIIIEDYFLDTSNGLLFRGLAKDINTKSANPEWIRIDQDLKNYIGRRAHIEFIDHGDGSFKVEEIRFGEAYKPEKEINKEVLDISNSKNLAELVDKTLKSSAFQKWFFNQQSIGHSADVKNEITKISDEINKIAKAIPKPAPVLAIADGFPIDNYVYDRGSHDKKGIDAPRAFLEALSGPTQNQSKTGSGRLELAEQILKDSRHFLARVQVNRIWLHLFGQGIVPTPDDFGVLGMKPTHPELLDHLALKYIEMGWSNKKMIQYIMASATYQQSSKKTNPVAAKNDPTNSLYHRANIRRLEGEIIRDIILQTSGELNTEMFGPSIPVYLTSFMSGRGRPASGPLDGKGRKSIYQAVKRNFLNPFFLTFDFPIPAQTIGKRNSSNVPAQALSLLNDPFVHQQADKLSQLLIEDLKKSSKEIVLSSLFMKLFSRTPSAKETQLLTPLLTDKESVKQLIHILFNKKEFTHVF